MPLRDFSLVVLICLVWALNVIVSKIAVSDLQTPPLFYTALRSAVIMLATLPWLLPMPRPRLQIFAVALLMGGAGFALLFLGLRDATPSAAAIVGQLSIPMTTVLSVMVLGETIRWRRKLGILLTFAGAMIVMWEPNGLQISSGLLLIAGSAFVGALGAVLLKRLHGIRPLQFQAWVGVSSTATMVPLSLMFESGQVTAASAAGWPLVAIVLFAALIVSVFAHTVYFGLLQRYDANLVAPLTLMTPLFAVGLGVVWLGDPFDLRMIVGSVVALAGVLIIALRPSRTVSPALVVRDRL